jgi:general secretion pathway protein G
MHPSHLAPRHARAARGFTLVEILIVVIILGILAAIVIPQFTSASEDARKNSVSSQLQTLRSQVELYKLQHRDQFPTADGTVGAAWDWEKLTGTTDADGDKSNSGFGPYLQAQPVNGLNGNTNMATAAAADVGFVIDANGKIFATGKTDTQYYDEGTGDDVASPTGFTAH